VKTNPALQALWGRVGGLTTAARHDAREITAPARQAFERRFLDSVDPERVLPEDERMRRASAARRAYFAGLTAKSIAARRRRTGPDPANEGRGPPRSGVRMT
jgi:hypothetical protein